MYTNTVEVRLAAVDKLALALLFALADSVKTAFVCNTANEFFVAIQLMVGVNVLVRLIANCLVL